MRTQALSFLLCSMLIVSASAGFSFSAIQEFTESFIASINYSDLNPTVESCGDAATETGVAALKLFTREIFDDPETLLNTFGAAFAQASIYCGKASMQVPEMLSYIGSGFRNTTIKGFSYNTASNTLGLNKYFYYFRYAYYKGMYADCGELAAGMIKMMIFGQEEIPTRRLLAQLEDMASFETADFTLGDNFNGLLQVAEGFFSDKVAPHLAKVNNTVNEFIDSIKELEGALISENVEKILNASSKFYQETIGLMDKVEPAVRELTETVGQEVEKIIKKDVDEVTKGVQKLIDDIPASVNKVQEMVADFERNEVKKLGQGIRNMFDMICNGISRKDF